MSEPTPLVVTDGIDKDFLAFARSNSLILGRSVVTYRAGKDGEAEAFRSSAHPEASFSAPAGQMVAPTSLTWPVPDALAGASVVVGGMGAGKSEFAFSRLGVTKVVRVGEPVERFDSDPRVVRAASFAEAIFLAVFHAKKGERVAVDGTRQLVFADLGPATEGGVSSGLYMALTNISNFAAVHQVHIVLTLNPMVREQLVAQVYNNVAASVTGGWLIEKGASVSETHRTGSGRDFSGSDELLDVRTPTLGSSMRNPGLSGNDSPRTPELQVFNTPDPQDDLVIPAREGSRIVFTPEE